MQLPLLCNATKAGPITFPDTLTNSALTQLCKSFGSNIFVIENHKSQLQALELTEHVDCKYGYIFDSHYTWGERRSQHYQPTSHRGCTNQFQTSQIFCQERARIEPKFSINKKSPQSKNWYNIESKGFFAHTFQEVKIAICND